MDLIDNRKFFRCSPLLFEYFRLRHRAHWFFPSMRISCAAENDSPHDFPRWSLLAAETWETAKSVVIRVEIPGIDEGDLDIDVEGNVLRIRGEKRSGSAQQRRRYHLMERAYGHFERSIPLPHGVDAERAEVSYRNGVLTAILPKTDTLPPRRLTISN